MIKVSVQDLLDRIDEWWGERVRAVHNALLDRDPMLPMAVGLIVCGLAFAALAAVIAGVVQW